MTVEDTLTYRLGWGIQFDPDLPINKAIADLEIAGFGMPNPLQPFGTDEWLKRLGTLPLMRQPGESWLSFSWIIWQMWAVAHRCLRASGPGVPQKPDRATH